MIMLSWALLFEDLNLWVMSLENYFGSVQADLES